MPPTPLFLAGETLSASKLQQLGDEDTYTPTLTAETVNPTLGTGATQDGQIWLNGNRVEIWFGITFGTSGAAAGTGTYYLPLPTAYPPRAGLLDTPVGEARLIDSGTTEEDAMIVLDVANDRVRMQGDVGAGGLVTDAIPWVWANNDSILGHLAYLTDFGA